MSEKIIRQYKRNVEGLIAFADGYTEDGLWIQEFVYDGEGRYLFFDCPPEGSEFEGERYERAVFFRAIDALENWNHQTAQDVSQHHLFKGLSL